MENTKEIQQYIQRSLEEALQGLAFWISYRQVLCYEHSINEGALVAELVLLLRAKLNSDFMIRNERKYIEKSKSKIRMDIEIAKKDNSDNKKNKDNKEKGVRMAIIEVKRFSAGEKLIRDDIDKLIRAQKEKNKNVLCYLVVISEKEIPDLFVKETGNAHKKNFSNENSFITNIRVLKAAKYLKGKKENPPTNTNYCCLLKISPTNQRGK